jgi:Lrp/AsnC family transcriptional regulator, leucine-responsive regulatory protein
MAWAEAGPRFDRIVTAFGARLARGRRTPAIDEWHCLADAAGKRRTGRLANGIIGYRLRCRGAGRRLMTITGIDEIDRKLIGLLQEDDRLPVAEMGKRLGVPPSTLNDRIRRLVRNGTITGFHAHISPEKVGLELLAFVFVGWSDPRTESDFLKRIGEAPHVLECHHVTGAWNYLIKVRLPRPADLEVFLRDIAKNFSGQLRTETLIALSTAKETAAVAPVLAA